MSTETSIDLGRVEDMVRQARSEATRQKIIDAAVDIIGERGYAATSMGDVISHAELTKGAVYYHFDSKDALATAVMEESSATLLDRFRSINQSGSPAIENAINGLFAVAEIIAGDKLVRSGAQLTRVLGNFDSTASRIQETWIQELSALAKQSIAQGDVRKDIQPEVIAELILSALLAALSRATSSADNSARLSQTCELLLSAVASNESFEFYHEFLARKSLRPIGEGASAE